MSITPFSKIGFTPIRTGVEKIFQYNIVKYLLLLLICVLWWELRPKTFSFSSSNENYSLKKCLGKAHEKKRFVYRPSAHPKFVRMIFFLFFYSSISPRRSLIALANYAQSCSKPMYHQSPWNKRRLSDKRFSVIIEVLVHWSTIIPQPYSVLHHTQWK